MMDGVLITYGSEVKALGEGRVGGYLVRFSGADDPDTTGDYFTPETDFGPAEKSVVLYHHGLDPQLSRRRLAEGTLKTDEVGVWVEAQLSLRDGYEKAIYAMAKAGKLGWSSGTASHLVERKEVREGVNAILSWPLGLDASLTPTPAEPRAQALSLKSLDVEPIPLTEDEEPCLECAAKSLPARTDHFLGLAEDLLAGYRQVKAAEVKVGRSLSASRRGRLEKAYALLRELLDETAPREEDASAGEEPLLLITDAPREGVAPKSLTPDAGLPEYVMTETFGPLRIRY